MTETEEALFRQPEPPATWSHPRRALWWLKKGGLAVGPEWEEAHRLCQAQEGERDHDLVHALAHWIEGDLGNSDYWYRRAGQDRIGNIEVEWARIDALLKDR